MVDHVGGRKGKRRQPPPALVEARRRAQERGCKRSQARSAGANKVVPISPRESGRKRGISSTGYTLLAGVILMSMYGMVMIFSASSGSALQAYGSSYYFLLRQAMWFGVGMVALAALARLDYRRLLGFSPLLMGISLAALLAVLFFGQMTYGSRRSLNLGPLVIQPSELAKMATLLFAVNYYQRRRDRLDSWREIFFPVLATTALACLFILLEPDLGSMIVVGLSAFVILFLAGAPWRKVFALVLGGLAATAVFIYSSPYRRVRFLSFLDPWSAPREGGFHIIQSMVALGSGRITGLGLGMSRQKFFYLPNAHTDFIFSIIGEELGLVGTLTVVGLFVMLLYLGLKIARRAKDEGGRILAMGITCVLCIQAVVNMGAATGLLPITGITLPFLSYGGSSLVICLSLVGILLNVSRQEDRRASAGNRRERVESGHMRRRHRGTPAPLARPGRGTRIA